VLSDLSKNSFRILAPTLCPLDDGPRIEGRQPTLVDAEAIRTGAVTVQNVAPLAYGDGQVVWGNRNLRFRLMVHLLLWQKSSRSTIQRPLFHLLKFQSERVVILGQSLSKQLLTMRNLLVRRLFSTISHNCGWGNASGFFEV